MSARGANGYCLQLQPWEVTFSDSHHIDAFDRLRVSNPTGIFDSTFQWDPTADILWQFLTTGGATRTVPTNSSSVQLGVAVAGDSAFLTTRRYHRYIPGKSQVAFMTGVFGAAVANVIKRAGFFEGNFGGPGNGIYFEQNGTTDVAWTVQSSVGGGAGTFDRVVQADWNVDPLDGTGPSGITLDLSKSYILVIDFQWLGMGRVRVGFDIGGQIVPVHSFNHSNVLDVPYMATPNLPLMWYIECSAGAGASSMLCTCAAIQSEGGEESTRGYPYSAGGAALLGAAAGVNTHLISIRPKAVFPAGGAINRVPILPEAFSVVATANPARCQVLYNSVAAGGAWVSAGANSAVEYNITAAGFAGGVPVQTFYVQAAGATRGAAKTTADLGRLPLTLDIAGANPRELSIVAAGVGGASNLAGAIDWRELR